MLNNRFGPACSLPTWGHRPIGLWLTLTLGCWMLGPLGDHPTSLTKDMGPLGPHTIPIRISKEMGMVWEAYDNRGSHCWELLESPFKLSFLGSMSIYGRVINHHSLSYDGCDINQKSSLKDMGQISTELLSLKTETKKPIRPKVW